MTRIAQEPAREQAGGSGPAAPSRRRRRRSREPHVLRIPTLLVTAMDLPLVLGCSWDLAKQWRDRDPEFPKPIRMLDEKSRPRWLVGQLEAYLRRKAEERGTA